MSKGLKFLFVISFVLALLPFLVLSFYCQPAADDFSLSAKAMAGTFSFIKNYYYNWSGRFFSQLILSFNPLVYKWMPGYRLLPVFLFVMLLFSFFFFINAIIRRHISLRQQLLGALVITVLYVHLMPAVPEGFYWMSGSLTYQLGNIAFLLLLGSYFHFKKMEKSPMKYILLMLTAVLVIAAVGSNEITMGAVLLLMIFVTTIEFKRKRLNVEGWLLFAVALVVSLIMIFAPGNDARLSFFEGRHDLVHSVIYSAAQLVRFSVKWFLNPVFLLLTALFIPLAGKLAERTAYRTADFYIHPFTAVMTWLVILFAGFFTVYWSMGILGQYRTVNVTYFLFLIGWFVNILVAVGHYQRKYNRTIRSYSSYIYFILVSALTLSLLFTGNTAQAYADIFSGAAYQYKSEQEERLGAMERAAGEGKHVLQVDILKNQPSTIHFIDLTEDPNSWINKCYSLYFGIDSISVKTDKH